MKKLFTPRLFLTIGLLAIAAGAFAGDNDGEKKRTYSKSYPVSANDKVSINNQFGEVKIVTWDKNEVKAEVTITTHAPSDEKAQSLLDGIIIQDGRNNDGVYFITVLPKGNNRNEEGKDRDRDRDKDKDKDKDKEKEKDKSRKGNEGMNIDYVISMPARNPLRLENQFGKSFVPDMTGPVEITQKFGELTAGNLSNVKTLQVEFSKARVENISNGKVVIKFSEASLKKMTGSIKANIEFSGKVSLPLDNQVTELTVNSSYSDVQVAVKPDFSGDFEIHTNFGDFKNTTQIPIAEKKDEDDHGPKFDKYFSGKSGSGACRVQLKSSFGNIRFI